MRLTQCSNDRANFIWVMLLLVIGIFYISNTWTPSSYGGPIKYFGVSDRGIVAGTPRGHRSDEWGVATPLTQATVNNDFQRFNQTSIYKEDLRSVFSMPIYDWGMIFKPNMWGYLAFPPAYAFSLYHYSFIFLFFVGFALFFQFLGSRPIESFLLSSALFFTGYMQFWWTTFGQLSSFFPWLFLLLVWNKPSIWIRAVFLYWMAAICMLSAHFYPPLFIQFAFVALILIFSLKPQLVTLKFCLLFGISVVTAAATAYLYLRDPLMAMLPTIYPGQRMSSGGGESLRMTLSQFFPLINLDNFRPLFRVNTPESGVISSLLFIIILFFLDYKKTFQQRTIPTYPILILSGALIICYLWMFVDLPAWVGRPLLWSRVDPHRMYFTSGMLMWVTALIFLTHGIFRLSLNRWVVLFLAFTGINLFFKTYVDELAPETFYPELFFLLALTIPCLIQKRFRQPTFRFVSVAVAAGYGIWAFYGYNPIQSASVIFDRETTLVTKALDTLISKDDQSILEVPGFPGATLNGWGYPSVSHVLLTPKLNFWKGVFPDLSDKNRNYLFNRYAIIEVSRKVEAPALVSADSVRIPVDSVTDTLANIRGVSWTRHAPPYSDNRGSIDEIICEGSQITISGWAWWQQKNSNQSVRVVSEMKPLRSNLLVIPRYDVASHFNNPHLVLAGFEIRSDLSFDCPSLNPPLCVISTDSNGNTYRLDNSSLKNCPVLPES